MPMLRTGEDKERIVLFPSHRLFPFVMERLAKVILHAVSLADFMKRIGVFTAMSQSVHVPTRVKL